MTAIKQSFYKAKFLLDKGGVFNLCLSDRSDGKTFDCKYRALVRYLQNREQSIYMRRFKSEITPEVYENFFDEVLHKLPTLSKEEQSELASIENYEFARAGKRILIREKGTKQWDTIVYIVPLSMSGKYKSIFDITRIFNIDLDEYIPLDGRYLKDEMPIYVSEFYKTIDRNRDKVQFNFFGNRVTAFNPFFDFFDINIDLTKNQIKSFKNGSVVVQLFSNKNNRNIESDTRFAQAIKGANNEDYYKGGILKQNIFNQNNLNGVSELASFKTELGTGALFVGEKGLVITTKQITSKYCIVDKIYGGKNEVVVTFGKFGNMLKKYYRTGKLFYENERAFYIFHPILTRVSVK